VTGLASSTSFEKARSSSPKIGPFSLAEDSQTVPFAITGDYYAADPAPLIFVEHKKLQEFSERFLELRR